MYMYTKYSLIVVVFKEHEVLKVKSKEVNSQFDCFFHCFEIKSQYENVRLRRLSII